MNEIARPCESSHKNMAINIGSLSIVAYTLIQLLLPTLTAQKLYAVAAKRGEASADLTLANDVYVQTLTLSKVFLTLN